MNIFMVQDTHEKLFAALNWFSVPRFSYLEWDYVRQKNMEYKQLAAFAATKQLLSNYLRVK